MIIGKRGLELIKEFEGLELEAYLCPAKVWTIGYGHTKTVRKGMKVTEKQAEALLKKDLERVEKAIETNVKVPLTQNQYDALCSFIYNVGGGAFQKSTLLRLLNAGDYEGAQAQFQRWNKASGVVLKGLVRRRAAERALFISKDAPVSRNPFVALLEALSALLSAIFKNKGA
ncbi:lysozyme [Candidatus Pelagibacter sp.]|nr:lysozyme [Candidatus Pelagibacter sp.]